MTGDRNSSILCCRFRIGSSTVAYGNKIGEAYIHGSNNANWNTGGGWTWSRTPSQVSGS
jgi:hypothetical protein